MEGGKSYINPIVLDPGVEKNPRVKPVLSTADVFKIPPSSSDFNEGSLIVWDYVSGPHITRFMPDSLNFIVTIKYSNPFKTLNTTHLTKKKNNEEPTLLEYGYDLNFFEKDLVTISNNHVEGRPFFWNPLSGPVASLVSEVEILCNGVVVQRDSTGFMSLYTSLNRMFCRKEYRTAFCGHDKILSTSEERTPVKSEFKVRKETISSSYKHALDESDSGSLCANDFTYCLSGSVDGLAFLGSSKSLSLQSMMNEPPGAPEFALLPPNTHLVIRLRLHDERALRLIDGRPNDVCYFGDQTRLTADEKRPKKIEIQIKDCFLLAQRFIPASSTEKLQKRMNTSYKYYIDQPIYRTVNIQSGHLTTQLKCAFPAGARLIFVALVKVHQLYRDPKNSVLSDATRFALPKEFKKIIFKLNGHPFIFDSGLEINGTNRQSSADARRLYDYYRDRRLTSDPFSSFWPAEGIGYKQAFALDLTPYNTELGEVEIGAEIHWKDAAPVELVCVMCSPQQKMISRSGNAFSLWESDAVGA